MGILNLKLLHDRINAKNLEFDYGKRMGIPMDRYLKIVAGEIEPNLYELRGMAEVLNISADHLINVEKEYIDNKEIDSFNYFDRSRLVQRGVESFYNFNIKTTKEPTIGISAKELYDWYMHHDLEYPHGSYEEFLNVISRLQEKNSETNELEFCVDPYYESLESTENVKLRGIVIQKHAESEASKYINVFNIYN